VTMFEEDDKRPREETAGEGEEPRRKRVSKWDTAPDPAAAVAPAVNGLSPEMLAQIARQAEGAMGLAMASPAQQGIAAFMGGMAAMGGGESNEILDVPQNCLGAIIGKAGTTIRSIREQSGAGVKVDSDMANGAPRRVHLTGSASAIAAAKALVEGVVSKEAGGSVVSLGATDPGAMGGAYGGVPPPSLPTGAPMYAQYGAPPADPYGAPPMQMAPAAGGSGPGFEDMMVPNLCVGKIIGKGGETISGIRNQSGADVKVDQDQRTGADRRVTLSGSPEAVAKAKQMIQEVINQMGGMPGGGMPGGGPPGAGEPGQTMDLPQRAVGRVIGRGGETIRNIQTQTGAHISIDQNMPDGAPRKLQCSGTPDQIQKALAMVNEILTEAGDLGPPSGGGGMGRPMPGMPPMMMPGMPPMQMGYGQPPYGQPPPYGMPPMGMPGAPQYGMPPQQQYAPPQQYQDPSQQYGAPPGAMPGMGAPPGPPPQVEWQTHQDDKGQTFYYNPATQESRWEKPEGM